MTPVNALHETERNALADLHRKLDDLDHLCVLARSHIDRNQMPAGSRLVHKAQAVQEALDIWSATKHATLAAQAAQRENISAARTRRGTA